MRGGRKNVFRMNYFIPLMATPFFRTLFVTSSIGWLFQCWTSDRCMISKCTGASIFVSTDWTESISSGPTPSPVKRNYRTQLFIYFRTDKLLCQDIGTWTLNSEHHWEKQQIQMFPCINGALPLRKGSIQCSCWMKISV